MKTERETYAKSYVTFCWGWSLQKTNCATGYNGSIKFWLQAFSRYRLSLRDGILKILRLDWLGLAGYWNTCFHEGVLLGLVDDLSYVFRRVKIVNFLHGGGKCLFHEFFAWFAQEGTDSICRPRLNTHTAIRLEFSCNLKYMQFGFFRWNTERTFLSTLNIWTIFCKDWH